MPTSTQLYNKIPVKPSSFCFCVVLILLNFAGATFGKYRIKLVSFEMEESLPEFPDQYHCIFLRVNETTQDFIFNGPVWYDYPNQKYRMDTKGKDFLHSCIYRYDKGVKYNVLKTKAGVNCTSEPLDQKMQPPLNLTNATYIQNVTLWRYPCREWEVTVQDTNTSEYLTYTFYDTRLGSPYGWVPFQLNDSHTNTRLNWEFFQPGKPDPSVFEPPSGSSCS